MNLEIRNPLTLAKNLLHMFISIILTVVRQANTMIAVVKQRGYSFTERPDHAETSSFGLSDGAFVLGAATVVALAAADRFGLVTLLMLA